MTNAARKSEVGLVYRFLTDPKTLFGAPPEFGDKRRDRGGPIWEAVWPIENSLGIVETGQLRILTSTSTDKPLTLAVVYRGNCVWRVDFVAASICHVNPFWAHGSGASPKVCGPHYHGWDSNRDHILGQSEWTLPSRRALPPQVRKFEQALPWLATEVNLLLTPDQRTFRLPETLL